MSSAGIAITPGKHDTVPGTNQIDWEDLALPCVRAGYKFEVAPECPEDKAAWICEWQGECSCWNNRIVFCCNFCSQLKGKCRLCYSPGSYVRMEPL